MSDFRNDPGFGQLFRNSYKDKDTQPDHKGTITTPDGKVYELAAWIKEGRNGKYVSLKIQNPFVKKEPTSVPKDEDLDDDIPF